MNSADQFEAIVHEHYEGLFRFAMSLTRVESDAWDLTQQTFYIWATKGHQLRDITKIKTWLRTTLHRAFLETRRRKVRFPHYELEEVANQLPSLDPEIVNRLDSSQVVSALSKVDEIYQAAVSLFYLEDCSYKEIASILDVPIGTVKSRISRGIEQLRAALAAEVPRASSHPNDAAARPETEPELPDGSAEKSPPPPGSDLPSAGSSGDNHGEWDFRDAFFREPFAAV